MYLLQVNFRTGLLNVRLWHHNANILAKRYIIKIVQETCTDLDILELETGGLYRNLSFCNLSNLVSPLATVPS